MGSGKSGTLINILRHKFNQERRLLRTLILCPPIVIKNWKREWALHSKLDPKQVVLLTGTGQRRLKDFQSLSPERHVFVTNYESLLMAPLFKALRLWGPEVLVLDESHRCKERKTKRTQACIELAEHAKHRYLLTGSPILNSMMDLFAQFQILDNGRTFGNNFFAFRARYFRDKNAGMPKDRYFPNWVPYEGAQDEIRRLIAQKSMHVTKAECMDLPPLVRQVIQVGMSPEQTRLYQEMKRDFITFIESGGESQAVVATMAMTKAMRLQQIASGYAMTENQGEVSLGQTPRQEALKELLEELTPNHKVLVWAVWKENYEQIRKVCEALGVPYVEVHGEISAAQKFANVDRFNTDPSVRVFLGHPGSGGIGINLVAASYSIFYSRTFSLEHSLQAEARNYRGGSEIHAKVTRIDLVAENTIDELVSEKLANKIEVSDSILRDLSLALKNQE